MRRTFLRTLTDLAEHDPRLMLLTGDLGYTVVEPFAERFPGRYFNVGVAEQNMVGLATGLAEGGFIPFVYSIATFASLRPYEFIRNGPVLHRSPVRVVGVGGGFEYGPAGSTHHGLEDIGVMRMQPGITVVAPADHRQTDTALRATWDLPGPIYYRLGKDEHTSLPGLEGRFELGRATVVRAGEDLAIVTIGSIAAQVAEAADCLATRGIECAVIVVASLNPSPDGDLVNILAGRRVALTVEAHYVTGGLGSLVSEVVAERGLGCRVIRCGVRAAPDGISGSEEYLLEAHGLSADRLVDTALGALGRLGP